MMQRATMAKTSTSRLRIAAVVAAVVVALLLVTVSQEGASAAATSPALDAWSKVEKVTGTLTYKFDTELTDSDGGFVSSHNAITLPVTLNRGTSSDDASYFSGSGRATVKIQSE